MPYLETMPGFDLPSHANPAAETFSVADRTYLAVAALGSLFTIDKPQKIEQVGQYMQSLHDALSENPLGVAVEPFMPTLLTNKFGLHALIKAFDAEQAVKTYTYPTLWQQHTVAELNSRQVIADTDQTADGGTTGQARVMLLGGTHASEPGLYATGEAFADGLQAGGNLSFINLVDYFMLNAQRREEGRPLLDTQTFTSFPQLGVKDADGGPRFPSSTASRDGQVMLCTLDGGVQSNRGFRISLGQEG